jgi:quinoprotein glucose dehydrogenase
VKIGLTALVLGLFGLSSCTNTIRDQQKDALKQGVDWPVYGGNKEGNRYSHLSQINLKNVKNLQIAWIYNSAEPQRADSSKFQPPDQIECQPIVVNGILYGTNAELMLFALQAATGKEIWKFDPFADQTPKFNVNRGVTYWENANDKRILYTAGSNLYAVNAVTGWPIENFGINGKVDLHEGLGINYDVSSLSVTATSPGVIYKDILILGSTVSESGDAAPGYVRGFDVITGKLRWIFHTMPQPGEFGYDSWPKDAYKQIGATNNWSGLSVDEKRALVYFGTGSPGADFYGGERAGIDLFSDCIIALQAETGRMKWYYQTIHHDLWDRDIPCPPNLVTVNQKGKKLDVVVQATKDGLLYVLDRKSGTSLFPVEERPVPTRGLPGEHPWATQKYPVKPLPFSDQVFTAADITNISPEAHAHVKKLFMRTSHSNKFMPPSTKGTLLFGYSGGAEWGGNAIDSSGILYQNANNALWELQMVSAANQQKEVSTLSEGPALYISNCSSCHGRDGKGNRIEIPGLFDLGSHLNEEEINNIIKDGKGRMPSFQNLSEWQRRTIIHFLLNGKTRAGGGVKESIAPDSFRVEKNQDFPYLPRYVNKVWRKVTDQQGYPGIKPPWGTLNAIDLNTGEYVWRVPLGEYPELSNKGIPITGTENYGGPLVTDGGLVFIAATRDERIRAFNKKTGALVWQFQLPAAGFATPVTYEIAGKQYLVIAAGGGRGLKSGGSYIAFALPGKDRQ